MANLEEQRAVLVTYLLPVPLEDSILELRIPQKSERARRERKSFAQAVVDIGATQFKKART